MTAQELIAWRERLGLTQPQAAFALGVSLRGYQKREADEAPIDREAQLATRYLEEHPDELPWVLRFNTGRAMHRADTEGPRATAGVELFNAKEEALSRAFELLDADIQAAPHLRQVGPAGTELDHSEIRTLLAQLS
ncbi:XRE family transcriptional regulator (plasmid) [Azospirillum brasilense]|uniref:XRE family transcriptional regulator n=1 Tax=Azospirillum brasilense TaxID=192 RepID=A0A4D8R690_AZOBR|nr:helix-turn-helix transcriptional regulator [Azospirillum brasilense]QCO18875.1 XRE family transcriptional regulator [Azospirillum brasilense]